jgi:hypothetical protein
VLLVWPRGSEIGERRKARAGQVLVRVEYPCHSSAVWVLEHQADADSLPCGEYGPGKKCPGPPVPTEMRVRLLRQGWEPVAEQATATTARCPSPRSRFRDRSGGRQPLAQMNP